MNEAVTKRRRSLRGAVVYSVLACLAGSALVGLAGATAVGADPPVPYTDSNAVGYIGLCNQAAQQITSGTLSATPFVWRAVSSQPAPAQYNAAGGTAILSAYLPMQGLPPGDWSGEQLTASSQYSNPQSPMAQATAKDEPLEDFVQDYPPEWDGFIQLRLYLGAPDEPAYVQHYPVLNLEISGDTWTAVGGGPVNCSAGNAESLETAVAPPSTTTTVSSSGGGGKATTATTATSDPPSANRPAAAAGSLSAHAKSGQISGFATDRPASSSGPAAAIFAGVVALLILLVLSALVVVRRRRGRQLSSTASESSVKGPQP
jgi:hypothetical protein